MSVPIYWRACLALAATFVALTQEARPQEDRPPLANKVEAEQNSTSDSMSKELVVRCRLLGNAKAWKARIPSSDKTADIFTLRFPGCGWVRGALGVTALELNAELVFNRDAELNGCSGISGNLLFRVDVDRSATTGASFEWEGQYLVPEGLIFSNLYGDQKSFNAIEFFSSDSTSKSKKLGEHLFTNTTPPGFEEYYFASIPILSDDGYGLSREIFEKTIGHPDASRVGWNIDLTISVLVFEPKAVCNLTDESGKQQTGPLNLKFVSEQM